MKRLTIFLHVILLLIFLISCEHQGDNKSEKVAKSRGNLNYEMEKVFAVEDGCVTDSIEKCTHVLIEYPLFTAPKMALANKFINHRIADALGYGDAESDSLVNLQGSAQHIIDEYTDFKNEFPDSPQVWNFRSLTHIIYEKDNLLCLKMLNESYMGGAHGSLNINYLNFDIKTGKPVNLLSRIPDTTRFIALAEKKFRKKRHLTSHADWGDAGFWFPKDRFTLPANIGINDHAYLLHYNPYEVASYADGPTDIVISFDELKKE